MGNKVRHTKKVREALDVDLKIKGRVGGKKEQETKAVILKRE